MKIVLNDVNYKGVFIEHVEIGLPNVNSLDDIPEGRLIEYIAEQLDLYVKY